MYEHGQRVELVHTNDPHTLLRPGDQGTIALYEPKLAQLQVDWDSGSRLAMLLDDGDEVRPIGPRRVGSRPPGIRVLRRSTRPRPCHGVFD
jgi:hypothetical protein